MNCFQLVKRVLDDAYCDIPGTNEQKDSVIKSQLKKLSHDYSQLVAGSNIVLSLIDGSEELRRCFLKENLNVTCVGGGPGSDLLGILKYMKQNSIKTNLMCNLLDSEKLWSNNWSDIGIKIGAEFPISTNFMPLDILKMESWDGFNNYLKANVFTFIYFISEVYKNKAQADIFFQHMFQKIKKDSYILFVDNRQREFYGWFDNLCVESGLFCIGSEEMRIYVPFDEEKSDLEEYFDKFGSPKLTASIAYRIVQKRK